MLLLLNQPICTLVSDMVVHMMFVYKGYINASVVDIVVSDVGQSSTCEG